jgi:putative ABC transport system substrate-binding protein
MKAKILVYVFPALILPAIHLAQAQQQKKIPRVGYLSASSAAEALFRTQPFRQGLRELGYVEGENLVIDFRYADGSSTVCPASRPN